MSRFYNKSNDKEELEKILEAARMPIFFSNEDVVCNLNKFLHHESPVLWITGMSGGGKTTLAKQLADKQNADVLLLDDVTFIFNHLKTIKEDKVIKKKYISNIYVALKKYVATPNVTDEGYFKTVTDELQKIVNKATNKKQLIIEGVLVPNLYKHDKTLIKENHAVVIKGTSLTTSFFRRLKRDDIKISEIFELICSYGYWYNNQNEFRKNITPNTESFNESEK